MAQGSLEIKGEEGGPRGGLMGLRRLISGAKRVLKGHNES